MLDEIFDMLLNGNEQPNIPNADPPCDDIPTDQFDDLILPIDESLKDVGFQGGSHPAETSLNSLFDPTQAEEDNIASEGGHNEPSFTGHTAGKCSQCSCEQFTPKKVGANDVSAMCQCGHTCDKHVWVS